MTTLNLQVAADTDDGTEKGRGTTWYQTDWDGGTDIATGKLSSTIYDGWARFLNADIPSGATIDSAYFKPYSNGDYNSLPASCEITAVEEASPAAPSGSNFPSGKTWTTARVTWNPDSWSSGRKTSPDIASVIQELVDDVGALTHLLVGWVDDASGNNSYYSWYDYGNSSANSAQLDVDYTAGGTQYEQAVAGTLTTAGALTRETAVTHEGTLTTAGALSRRTTRALAGTLTMSGALVAQARKALAGILTTAGSLARLTARSFGGTLTSAGQLSRKTSYSLAGTLSSAGSLNAIKVTVKSLAGTLTMAGSLSRTAQKSVAGTLTMGGTLGRAISVSVGGTLAMSGSLVRGIRTTVAGALSFVGTLVGQLISGGAALSIIDLGASYDPIIDLGASYDPVINLEASYGD